MNSIKYNLPSKMKVKFKVLFLSSVNFTINYLMWRSDNPDPPHRSGYSRMRRDWIRINARPEWNRNEAKCDAYLEMYSCFALRFYVLCCCNFYSFRFSIGRLNQQLTTKLLASTCLFNLWFWVVFIIRRLKTGMIGGYLDLFNL